MTRNITVAPVVRWDYESQDGRVAQCVVSSPRDGCWEVRFTAGTYADTACFSTRRQAMRCAVAIEDMLLGQQWTKRARSFPNVAIATSLGRQKPADT